MTLRWYNEVIIFSSYDSKVDSLDILNLSGDIICVLENEEIFSNELNAINISSCSLNLGEVYLFLAYTSRHFSEINLVVR